MKPHDQATELLFMLYDEHEPTPEGERHALLDWYRIVARGDWPDLHTPPLTS